MLLSEATRQRIQELMKEHNIKTLNELSNLAGISNTLNDFMSKKNELLQIDTILHLCEAFNIQLYEFFYSPLFKDTHYEKSKK